MDSKEKTPEYWVKFNRVIEAIKYLQNVLFLGCHVTVDLPSFYREFHTHSGFIEALEKYGLIIYSPHGLVATNLLMEFHYKEDVEKFMQYIASDTPPVKPPLGLTPRWLMDEKRQTEILAAIDRFGEAGKPIPAEWIEEYNEIVERLSKRKLAKPTSNA